MRRWAELVLLVLAVAVLARYRPAPEPLHDAPHPQAPTALSIVGIHLGMTRDEVVNKLGPPAKDEPIGYYPGFRSAKYGSGIYGQPDLVYDAQNRVVSVEGDALRWRGGAVQAGISMEEVSALLPNLVEIRAPASHPAGPGELYLPGSNITLLSECHGYLFANEPNTLYRVQLSVPYFSRTYWTRLSHTDDLLTRTAERCFRSNRASVESAQVVGCFYCLKILHTKPFYFESEKDCACCPDCKAQALLAGSRSEITPDHLRQVHNAWLEPPRS